MFSKLNCNESRIGVNQLVSLEITKICGNQELKEER